MIETYQQWYALYLRSRYEKKVCEDLQKKDLEPFLPLIEEIHMWSDRKKKVLEPLFRGYIFIKADLRDKETILMTNGVVRFVGINNRPSSIPELQIDWIKRIVGESREIRHERYLNVGEHVRVKTGPLMGVEGIITRLQGITRLTISIAPIEQSISIQISPEFIEVIRKN